MWYEITPDEREEWARNAGRADDSTAPWSLHDDRETHLISIRSTDADVADRALADWLERNPRIKVLAGSRAIAAIPSSSMRDGTIVQGDVLVEVRYTIE